MRKILVGVFLIMEVTPGEYEIYYGNSSAKENLKTLKIEIQ